MKPSILISYLKILSERYKACFNPPADAFQASVDSITYELHFECFKLSVQVSKACENSKYIKSKKFVPNLRIKNLIIYFNYKYEQVIFLLHYHIFHQNLEFIVQELNDHKFDSLDRLIYNLLEIYSIPGDSKIKMGTFECLIAFEHFLKWYSASEMFSQNSIFSTPKFIERDGDIYSKLVYFATRSFSQKSDYFFKVAIRQHNNYSALNTSKLSIKQFDDVLENFDSKKTGFLYNGEIDAQYFLELDPILVIDSSLKCKLEKLDGVGLLCEKINTVNYKRALLTLQHRDAVANLVSQITLPDGSHHLYNFNDKNTEVLFNLRVVTLTKPSAILKLLPILQNQASLQSFCESFLGRSTITNFDPTSLMNFNVILNLHKHLIIEPMLCEMKENKFFFGIKFNHNGVKNVKIKSSRPIPYLTDSKLKEILKLLQYTHSLPIALVWLTKQLKLISNVKSDPKIHIDTVKTKNDDKNLCEKLYNSIKISRSVIDIPYQNNQSDGLFSGADKLLLLRSPKQIKDSPRNKYHSDETSYQMRPLDQLLSFNDSGSLPNSTSLKKESSLLNEKLEVAKILDYRTFFEQPIYVKPQQTSNYYPGSRGPVPGTHMTHLIPIANQNQVNLNAMPTNSAPITSSLTHLFEQVNTVGLEQVVSPMGTGGVHNSTTNTPGSTSLSSMISSNEPLIAQDQNSASVIQTITQTVPIQPLNSPIAKRKDLSFDSQKSELNASQSFELNTPTKSEDSLTDNLNATSSSTNVSSGSMLVSLLNEESPYQPLSTTVSGTSMPTNPFIFNNSSNYDPIAPFENRRIEESSEKNKAGRKRKNMALSPGLPTHQSPTLSRSLSENPPPNMGHTTPLKQSRFSFSSMVNPQVSPGVNTVSNQSVNSIQVNRQTSLNVYDFDDLAPTSSQNPLGFSSSTVLTGNNSSSTNSLQISPASIAPHQSNSPASISRQGGSSSYGEALSQVPSGGPTVIERKSSLKLTLKNISAVSSIDSSTKPPQIEEKKRTIGSKPLTALQLMQRIPSVLNSDDSQDPYCNKESQKAVIKWKKEKKRKIVGTSDTDYCSKLSPSDPFTLTSSVDSPKRTPGLDMSPNVWKHTGLGGLNQPKKRKKTLVPGLTPSKVGRPPGSTSSKKAGLLTGENVSKIKSQVSSFNIPQVEINPNSSSNVASGSSALKGYKIPKKKSISPENKSDIDNLQGTIDRSAIANENFNLLQTANENQRPSQNLPQLNVQNASNQPINQLQNNPKKLTGSTPTQSAGRRISDIVDKLRSGVNPSAPGNINQSSDVTFNNDLKLTTNLITTDTPASPSDLMEGPVSPRGPMHNINQSTVPVSIPISTSSIASKIIPIIPTKNSFADSDINPSRTASPVSNAIPKHQQWPGPNSMNYPRNMIPNGHMNYLGSQLPPHAQWQNFRPTAFAMQHGAPRIPGMFGPNGKQ